MAHQFPYLDPSLQKELKAIANSIVVIGKGILAMDEFNDEMESKLKASGKSNSPEERRKYRQTILTSPGIEKFVSGVILYDETIWQKLDNGKTFPEHLNSLGIACGVKADCNVVDLEGTNGETSTQGLNDLLERAKKYKSAGCKFAKWRNALKIGPNEPSQLAIQDAAYLQARYARICQQAGLVPVVEPDISNVGTHDLETCQKATEKVLSAVYKSLNDHNVYLEGTLLKPNFATPGLSGPKVTKEQVADATITAFRRTVPAAVPGCCFLSGGLGEELSTVYLNEVNVRKGNSPWALTFSYGRALQGSAWNVYGKSTDDAQKEFIKRAEANSKASQGEWTA